jgi:hypothetical protein
LSTVQALEILGGLRGINLVGMDVVEVAPAYDHADITAWRGDPGHGNAVLVCGAAQGELNSRRIDRGASRAAVRRCDLMHESPY